MPEIKCLSPEQRETFIRLIAKHTGLEIRERDQANLSAKIFARMKALKLDSPTLYYQILDSAAIDSYQEWLSLMMLLTNVESYFFRDQEQFSLLRHQILPELIAHNQDNKRLRICSAGCSSGEEPYSIAMLLKELLPDLAQWKVSILGLDINQVALEKAKSGIYSAWSFRSVRAEVKQRYFEFSDKQYHLHPDIKQMVKFQTLNLFKDPFPQPNSELSNFDLILCRNVFIYFKTSAIAKVLSKFYSALQPSGYLLTGHAELSNQDLSQFQIRVFPESLAYQRSGSDLSSSSLSYSSSDLDDILTADEFNAPDHDAFTGSFEKSNLRMQEVALNLLKQLPPETKIQKLGDLTAAELISQLETELQSIHQEET